jgi:AraC family transcriptional regulator of adaptative response/methylated-DNA-[protein]-cysteine methyltransferase
MLPAPVTRRAAAATQQSTTTHVPRRSYTDTLRKNRSVGASECAQHLDWRLAAVTGRLSKMDASTVNPAHAAPMALPNEKRLRNAVAARDPAYDGRFVYGVATTRVFCRPSCPSRAARPENLRFFGTPAAAAAAGFRPCKRCRPDAREPGTTRRIRDLARYIEEHADEALPLARLAREAHLSPAHLQRRFKATLGVSPKAFQDAVRLRTLKGALRQGRAVLEAIEDAGFQSTSRVYGNATRGLGMTPSRYRAGGAHETISHAARRTSLGWLMMAATERGVCFAEFGANRARLEERLRAEFPHATLRRTGPGAAPQLDAWVAALEAHLAASAPRPELPLDLRGTAFQIRVWRFLLGIPAGTVATYRDLAAGIGSPGAVRAAASACAANRIAVLVPCHRVLRSDGALGGYRWGVDRKRALLAAEGVPASR